MKSQCEQGLMASLTSLDDVSMIPNYAHSDWLVGRGESLSNSAKLCTLSKATAILE